MGQEEPPCSLALASVCPRRSPPWHLPPSRSRLSLLLSVSTPCGLEDLFLRPFPLSRVCGSARRNMTSLGHQLYTASASKTFSNVKSNQLECCSLKFWRTALAC